MRSFALITNLMERGLLMCSTERCGGGTIQSVRFAKDSPSWVCGSILFVHQSVLRSVRSVRSVSCSKKIPRDLWLSVVNKMRASRQSIPSQTQILHQSKRRALQQIRCLPTLPKCPSRPSVPWPWEVGCML